MFRSSPLHDIENTKAFSYADDAYFVIQGHNIEEIESSINNTLEKFLAFCNSVNIKLNLGKTFYVLNTSSGMTKIWKNDTEIKRKISFKILGIFLNNKLNYVSHTDSPNKHLIISTRLINNFGKFVTEKNVWNLITSLILGKFNHASSYQSVFNVSSYNKQQARMNQILGKYCRRAILSDFKNKRLNSNKNNSVKNSIAGHAKIS